MTLARTSLPIALVLALTTGCNPGTSGPDDDPNNPANDSTVQGRVDDGAGQQSLSFGGAGTMEAAQTARLSRVKDDGSLEVISETSIDSSGSYSLEAPSSQDRMVLEALDASGEVVAAAILEATAEAEGGAVTATPMDSESTVEARVFVEMIAHGVQKSDVNVVDLRGRIDAAMASAVKASSEQGGDAEAQLTVLAEAMWAAQRSEEMAYADMGLDLSQADMFMMELDVSQALSAALDAGEPAEISYDAFFDAIVLVHEEAGADARTQSEAEAQASFSTRLIVEQRLGSEAADLAEATVVHAAEGEAMLTARATEAILASADVTAAVEAHAEDAAEDLTSDVDAAADAAEAHEAWATWRAELVGEGSVEGSVLGDALQVNAVTAATVDVALGSAWMARERFESEVIDEVTAALDTNASLSGSADATAEAVADGRMVYHSTLEDIASELSILEELDTFTSIVIEADGSFVAAAQ
ncbi:MAG: hypothetical protein H6739_31105 [Alphaproteobacteria bacterium]|nr:hypothetical protein [Alphaproteobacteria bacterium]